MEAYSCKEPRVPFVIFTITCRNDVICTGDTQLFVTVARAIDIVTLPLRAVPSGPLKVPLIVISCAERQIGRSKKASGLSTPNIFKVIITQRQRSE